MSFDWTPRYLTVDRIDVDPDDGTIGTIELVRASGFPDSEGFTELLDSHIERTVKVKPDTGKSSPCKAYSFIDNERGEDDQELLENRLLTALDLESFAEATEVLRLKVKEMIGLRSGLLVVMVFDAIWEDERGSRKLFVSLIEFDHVERLGEGISVEDIAQTLSREPRQAILYPFGDPEEERFDLVKILNKPASHFFPDIFAVRAPPTTEALLQIEVAKAVKAADLDGWPGREDYLKRVPPKRRDLLGIERVVQKEHYLKEDQAAAVARESNRTAKDLLNKKQVLKLVTDAGNLDLDPSGFGANFAFAQEDGFEFVVIRTRRITTSQGGLSAIEFSEVPTLFEVCDRMTEDA